MAVSSLHLSVIQYDGNYLGNLCYTREAVEMTFFDLKGSIKETM